MKYTFISILILSSCAFKPIDSDEPQTTWIAPQEPAGLGLFERKKTYYERCTEGNEWERYGSVPQCIQEKQFIDVRNQETRQYITRMRRAEQLEAERQKQESDRQFYQNINNGFNNISSGIAGTNNKPKMKCTTRNSVPFPNKYQPGELITECE